MKINMKLLGATALAFVLCGCGGGNPADKYAAPKIAEGAVLAFGFDQEQINKIQAAAIGEEKCKKLSEEVWKAMPKEIVEVNKAAGLEYAKARWGVLSIGQPAFKEDWDLKETPEIAMAIAVDIDIEKAVAAIREQQKKEKDDEVALVDATAAGVKAWKIVDKEGELAKAKAEPCFAALDGKLLLAASTLAALEKQIKLYRDGVGASTAFAGFAFASGDLLRLKLLDIGAIVKKAVPKPEESLKMLNQFVPEGAKMILGLKTLDFAATATADNGLAFKLSLGTASEKDADQLRTIAKTTMMPVTAQLKESAKENADAKNNLAIVESLKIAGPEGTFEASLVVPASILKEYGQEFVAKAEKDMAESQKK